jgi:hypothetical protein
VRASSTLKTWVSTIVRSSQTVPITATSSCLRGDF